MKSFSGRIAVITGAGMGMGRELAVQLARGGCHVALCDVQQQQLEETRALCLEQAPSGTRVTVSLCDVADESSVLAFRDAVLREHGASQVNPHVNLVFNNAGIGGGGSFINDAREDWERTFAVCWGGVYLCTRAFLPLLIASDEGHLVNTSSVNGFWACFGTARAHTAYSSAKFAVKGFTEALIIDLRLNAPHVKVSLVMPGHIGTSIIQNSQQLLHGRSFLEMKDKEVAMVRGSLSNAGLPVDGLSDEQLRAGLQRFADDFRDNAPTSAAQAATIILDGVRNERWRILVGDDASALDAAVRRDPEGAYEVTFGQEVAERSKISASSIRPPPNES
jgi:NAD(P)-dependent dehydrogenase (short-subunit alcohol dehydrogenase family)